MEHLLKIEPVFLDQIISGEKTFELRKNDRNYQKGDIIKFTDLTKNNFLGESYYFNVLSVFSCEEYYGLRNGYVILSIEKK